MISVAILLLATSSAQQDWFEPFKLEPYVPEEEVSNAGRVMGLEETIESPNPSMKVSASPSMAVLSSRETRADSTCTENCLQCEGTACVKCEEGFYVKSKRCTACAVGCKACVDELKCTACTSSFELTQDRVCSREGCPEGCRDCDENDKCTYCQPGWYISKGLCRRCIPNCLECHILSTCTRCAPGTNWNPLKVKCIGTCDSVNHCSVCSGGKCTVCDEGYYLKKGACSACEKNCAGCDNGDSCFMCAQTHFLNGTSCRSCSSITSGCSHCNPDGECLGCADGTFLDENVKCATGAGSAIKLKVASMMLALLLLRFW